MRTTSSLRSHGYLDVIREMWIILRSVLQQIQQAVKVSFHNEHIFAPTISQNVQLIRFAARLL